MSLEPARFAPEARKLASSAHWTLPDLYTVSARGESLHALVWQEENYLGLCLSCVWLLLQSVLCFVRMLVVVGFPLSISPSCYTFSPDKTGTTVQKEPPKR